MSQKECPSCALEVDSNHRECPYCEYEFPDEPGGGSYLLIFFMIALLVLWVFL